eukprot:scaffold56697_cov68-Phaeocystis_antarctica.AAC.1
MRLAVGLHHLHEFVRHVHVHRDSFDEEVQLQRHAREQDARVVDLVLKAIDALVDAVRHVELVSALLLGLGAGDPDYRRHIAVRSMRFRRASATKFATDRPIEWFIGLVKGT